MTGTRTLSALPYDAASQFNRYLEAEKSSDCKYNPPPEAKSEFQPTVVTQPLQQPPPPPSGKNGAGQERAQQKSADACAQQAEPSAEQAVKHEPVSSVVFEVQPSADLGQPQAEQQQPNFVVVATAVPPTTTTATAMLVGVCSWCYSMEFHRFFKKKSAIVNTKEPFTTTHTL